MTDHRAYLRARPYADALHQLIKKSHTPDITYIRALRAAESFFKERRAALILCDVANITFDSMSRLLFAHMSTIGDTLLFNQLVSLLYTRRMLKILPEIFERLLHLCAQDIACGVVTITLVDPLSEELQARIFERIRAMGNYSMVLADVVYDPSLIAGFILTSRDGWSADFSIRGSLRYSVQALRTNLLTY